MKLLNYEFEGSTIHFYFENDIELMVEDWGNGTKVWYQNGLYHRLDGPAFERKNGTKYWCKNGDFHRLDGPAIERPNGNNEWFIEGEVYSEKEFNQKVKEVN